MQIKERMTKNPLTTTKDTTINKVMDMMTENKLHRIPVVEGKKLIGLVTKGMISEKGASNATSLSVFELNYLLSKVTVSTIMEREVVTVNENANLEEAANLMLKNDVGCVIVINDAGELTGILTQNDLFAAFIDLLGYNESGTRFDVEVEDKIGEIGEISKVFSKNNCNISHIGVYERDNGKAKIVIHIINTETGNLKSDLEAAGVKIISISATGAK